MKTFLVLLPSLLVVDHVFVESFHQSHMKHAMTKAKNPTSCSSSFSFSSLTSSNALSASNNDDDVAESEDGDEEASSPATVSIDVSDLGITMDDLNAPLPQDFLQNIQTSGYESTSRLPDVNDNGCKWIETTSDETLSDSSGTLDVTLTIPGLRGQPSGSLNVEFATNTITVTSFGYVVWSAILRGNVLPSTAQFIAKDGPDTVPIIELSVQKEKNSSSIDDDNRWGGFILQIGENSLL